MKENEQKETREQIRDGFDGLGKVSCLWTIISSILFLLGVFLPAISYNTTILESTEQTWSIFDLLMGKSEYFSVNSVLLLFWVILYSVSVLFMTYFTERIKKKGWNSAKVKGIAIFIVVKAILFFAISVFLVGMLPVGPYDPRTGSIVAEWKFGSFILVFISMFDFAIDMVFFSVIRLAEKNGVVDVIVKRKKLLNWFNLNVMEPVFKEEKDGTEEQGDSEKDVEEK